MNQHSISFITHSSSVVDNRFNESQVDNQFDQRQSSTLQSPSIREKVILPPIKEFDHFVPRPLKRKVSVLEPTNPSLENDSANLSNSKKQNTTISTTYDFKNTPIESFEQQIETEEKSKKKTKLMEDALRSAFRINKFGKLKSKEIENFLDRVNDLERSGGNFLHFLVERVNTAKTNREKFLCLLKEIKKNTTHPLLTQKNKNGLDYLELWDRLLLEKFENCFYEVNEPRRKLLKLVCDGDYPSEFCFENSVEGKYDKGDSILHYAVRRLASEEISETANNLNKISQILDILDKNVRFHGIIRLIGLKNSKGQNFYDLYNSLISADRFAHTRDKIKILIELVEQRGLEGSNSRLDSSSLHDASGSNQDNDYRAQIESLRIGVQDLEEKDGDLITRARVLDAHAKMLIRQATNLKQINLARADKEKVLEQLRNIRAIYDRNLARLKSL